MSSSVERSLLASTQQRQSPANATVIGLLNFALDGVKLFSKVSTASQSAVLVLISVFVLYLVVLLLDNSLERSAVSSIFSVQLNAWLLVGLLEVISFVNMAVVQNSYVGIAFSRLVELVVAVEITLSLIVIILFLLSLVGKDTATLRSTSTLLVASLVGVLLFVNGEKVPFDLVEAESELIDGVTTEFEGYAFSLVYAAEVVVAFITIKVLFWFSGFVVLPVVCAVICSFIGRIFLCRYLITDALEFLFSVGLVVSLLALLMVCALRWEGL